MALSYEATLAQVSQRMTERRNSFEAERQHALVLRRQLEALLQRISALPTAFDEEDRACVQSQLQANHEKCEKLEKEMRAEEARRKEREELFRCMKCAIEERTRVLEDDDDCLSAHPEMLQYFARKQVSLQTLLRAKEEESLSTVSRTSTC